MSNQYFVHQKLIWYYMPSAIKTKKEQLNAKRDPFSCSLPSRGGKENKKNPAGLVTVLNNHNFCHCSQAQQRKLQESHIICRGSHSKCGSRRKICCYTSTRKGTWYLPGTRAATSHQSIQLHPIKVEVFPVCEIWNRWLSHQMYTHPHQKHTHIHKIKKAWHHQMNNFPVTVPQNSRSMNCLTKNPKQLF